MVTARNLRFTQDLEPQRHWLAGDPVASTFYNALSLTFPPGEAFFIESVRRFADELPEGQTADVRAFIQQEVLHSREHLAFNRLLAATGYDTRGIESRLAQRIATARGTPPVIQLTITAALEHYTAILADDFLRHPEDMATVAPGIRRLWTWHALEEIEHKAVAFDVLLLATRTMTPVRRWMMRTLVMLRVTWQFWSSRFVDMADLYRQDGGNRPGVWLRTLRFLLVKPGILRRILPGWLAWFHPRFHPWRHDNQALMERAEQQLGAS